MEKLYYELREVIAELNIMQEKIVRDADRLGASPFQMMSTHGEMLLSPIIVAKANALAALANLREK